MKGASTTPVEFLAQVREQWPDAWRAADVLTRLYTRVRFGQTPLTTEERSDAEDLLQSLRTLRRPAPPRAGRNAPLISTFRRRVLMLGKRYRLW